jgi:hypothetical protein
MNFAHETNKVLLIDGMLFMLLGSTMIFSPNSQNKLKEKVDSKLSAPALRDLRRGIGAAYLAMGLFVAALGGIITKESDLNSVAQIRGISLVIIVIAGLMQISSKRWKIGGYQIMYTFLYGVLILAYIYLGVIEPA